MPELSYREAVRDAMSQAMREDEDVFLMGEDIAEMGGSMGVTHGMLEGFGPERIVNQAAKHRYMSGGQLKVPLTIRTQGGAGWSPGAQHAQQLEAWFVHVPGLRVVVAAAPPDVGGLLWSSIYDDICVVFFEHRTRYGLREDVREEMEPIPI